jgi:hypothetical protein
MFLMYLIIILVYSVLIIPVWKICGRAGFHPALSLIAIIPLLGLLLIAAILAFSEWPATNQSAIIKEG